jgi:hypothetical protein
MITGYKGQTEMDVANFYCPYVPIFKIVRGERRVFYIDTTTPPPPTPTELQLQIMEMVRNPRGYI